MPPSIWCIQELVSSSNRNGNQPKFAGRYGHGRQGDAGIEGHVSWNIGGFLVKGCKCKKGKKFTVTLKDLRLDGTKFKQLFGVGRKSHWTVDEYSECYFLAG